MKTRKFVTTALALIMTLGSVGSFARDHDRRERDRERDRMRDRGPDMRRGGPPPGSPPGFAPGRGGPGRGEGWGPPPPPGGLYPIGHPEWRRGSRLPPEYRSYNYVVEDWRGHHLRRPPRGYHWVQHGSDYLLVGIATGLIADMIINR